LNGRVSPTDVVSFSDHVGPGYGHVTEAALEAMALLARTEGIILDPIYNGKTFACYLDHVAEGRFRDDDVVVLIHTGGTPAIFSHALALREHLRSHPDTVGAARARRRSPATAANAP
jgi:1-aminocyclopropane-1-carboxylate deaminase/D-cysteine desulfhydrase-like pyridoxal-dependent ACC family enzyme